MHSSVGSREHNKAINGLSSLSGGKGIVRLEYLMKENLLEFGSNILQNLLRHHPFVSIDLGVINEISMITALGQFDESSGDVNFTIFPYRKKSTSKYDGSGIDRYLHLRSTQLSKLEEHIINLSVNHGRTVNVQKYVSHEEAFHRDGEIILMDNFKEENLLLKKKLDNRKRSHWATLPNTILEFVDAASRTLERENLDSPIIIIGNPTFSASMKGKRAAAPKKTIEYLQRFFTVVIIDEYLTSQLCPCRETFVLFYKNVMAKINTIVPTTSPTELTNGNTKDSFLPFL